MNKLKKNLLIQSKFTTDLNHLSCFKNFFLVFSSQIFKPLFFQGIISIILSETFDFLSVSTLCYLVISNQTEDTE